MRLERALDKLAGIMSRRTDGELLLPLFRRLEADIIEQRTVEAAMARARERAKRSTARTAARSA
jgi:hypothetical protein